MANHGSTQAQFHNKVTNRRDDMFLLPRDTSFKPSDAWSVLVCSLLFFPFKGIALVSTSSLLRFTEALQRNKYDYGQCGIDFVVVSH